ncbi:uncharacterized protein LOC125468812 [Pyrus x bretschneideri]|uniref:uncharacterized protein LOC125468812 n=1 Tax=Pyrus x bretschneideri TaxID=225117 RepID=UPI00202F67ED|nr:uncharacterized protein LOC125468812 [Pyrus x bretschneideri]
MSSSYILFSCISKVTNYTELQRLARVFVEIFYVGHDASKEFGSQFFLEWPTLDDDEFNLDGFGEIGINQATDTDKAAKKNPRSDTFVIKTLQLEHQCGRVDKLLCANSRWLSEHYIDILRTNPNWDVDDIMAEVRREFNLVVTRNQVFRAKRLTREVIEGSYVKQYARLWDYVEKLKKANVGGKIKILTAIGINLNNGLFPIAYAIVEIENKSTWVWFLELLIANLKIKTDLAWAFRPILGLLDNINKYIMLRMANRRAARRNWKHPDGPRIFKIIEKSKVESTYCIRKMVGENEHLVQHLSGRQFVVNLKESTCSCKRWDLCGIPCSHAIACIFAKDESVYAYVYDCYKKEAYLNSYDPIIYPIPGMDLWDRTDLTPLKPPICKKQLGRPN